jgi:hypothetical protein
MNTTTTTTNLEVLANDIKAGVAKIGRIVRKGLHEAKEIGGKLAEAKAICQAEGTNFMVWVKENCQISYRQASNYILVHTNWDLVPADELAELSINKFVGLVSGKVTPKKPAKARQSYTGEYVQRMAAECKVTGNVNEFLKRFGVRVAASEMAVAA